MDKIKKIIVEECLKAKKFGFKIAFFDFVCRAFKHNFFYNQKHYNILKFLKSEFQNIISEYNDEKFFKKYAFIGDNYPIWVFWYQPSENIGGGDRLSLIAAFLV